MSAAEMPAAGMPGGGQCPGSFIFLTAGGSALSVAAGVAEPRNSISSASIVSVDDGGDEGDASGEEDEGESAGAALGGGFVAASAMASARIAGVVM